MKPIGSLAIVPRTYDARYLIASKNDGQQKKDPTGSSFVAESQLTSQSANHQLARQ
ncbi:MAG: hypothetical protein V4772_20265 [Pseudomonadota bacterium]